MNRQGFVALCVALVVVVGLAISPAAAQPVAREPDFAEKVDTFTDRMSTKANQQKFFSILIFVVVGGGSTYAVLRGVKKVVSKD